MAKPREFFSVQHIKSGPAAWAVLAALAAAFAGVLSLLHIAAGFLIGPMIAAIWLAARGTQLRVPEPLFYFAQGVIGCLVARSITPAIIGTLRGDWLIFLLVILAIIAASTLVGYVLVRQRLLPGTSAVWGTSAGAATAMTMMAADYGEDIRFVAFMQYLRAAIVALCSTFIAEACGGTTAAASPALPARHLMNWGGFGATIIVIIVGIYIAKRLKIPGGTIIVPMALGAAVQLSGTAPMTLPPAFLAASYAVIGISIGLRFTKDTVKAASKALPAILVAIFALMASCAALGGVLSALTGISWLTAYFATTPGGMDSAAIIASGTNVDMPFVMALQFARFILVVLLGPHAARFAAERSLSENSSK